ncbi:MAG: hypothetical protein H0U92_15020 [Actinobacteria bacterium]|nr:hypothetical protein [Actinomycetota bacterium]
MALRRNRIRFGAALLALALVAGACGGGGSNDKKVSSDKTTTSVESSDVTLDASSDTTVAGGLIGTTATTKKGAASATAKPGGGSSGTAGAPGTDPNAVPGPAKEGTYGYAQSGSTTDGPVPAAGTLVVSGGTTQLFKRYYDPNKSPLVLTYVFRDNGPYITAATITAKGASIICSFGNGVPVPPWPPTPGKTFSGTGNCSSPIGPMTATVAGSVTSRNGDLVGIDATVHAKNAANSVDVTLHDVEQWAISLRVPKSSHQTYEGTAFNQPISGDVTSTLTSTP